jgi:ribosomal protein S18 acetylase RimI-like enzyme
VRATCCRTISHERLLIVALGDRLIEERRGDLLLTTDRTRVDLDAVLALLLDSHWGGGMTLPVLERAIANSVTVGVLDGAGRQLGFARAVSDLATYAYLTDVIVAAHARGKGIGSWMIEAILGHPDLQGLRRIALYTRDARALYERYGFTTDPPASVYMELRAR